MEYRIRGRIIKGVGGNYYVRPDGEEGERLLACRARGKFRHAGITPLVGDNVILLGDRPFSEPTAEGEKSEIVLDEIVDRKSALIRPPLANLDVLFVSMASAFPSPILSTVDKLISIAEANGIEPVIIVGKSDLDGESTEKLVTLYRNAGFTVFPLSAKNGEGLEAVTDYIKTNLTGKIAAFAGASGVGKSSLLARLFPERSIETGEISQKIERGKNTTRHVELFPYACEGGTGYIADTPGFSLLDFVRFDFFDKETLPSTMREFRTHLGHCRFKKCTHTKEEGCAILHAVKEGEIAPSRHASFLEMYDSLKDKRDWKKG
ncbi:MAG: ribosome small subunit-dependent GTPase A [Ruminococcaceae bacterium]|nr:ribosome small subunit-dependent GTPase A [Oscillospiraceae bacterium]